MVLANTVIDGHINESKIDYGDEGILILKGPVHSGKTTALQKWMSNRADVHGIITPVINERRVFINIKTHEKFRMEATEPDKQTLVIGRFVFSKMAFAKA